MGNKNNKSGSVNHKKGVKSLGTEKMKRTSHNPNLKVTLNDFQMIKVVGKGAYGEVRLVRKKDDEKLYAMKVMLKQNLKNSQIPRLLAERDLMAFANHDYIVKLHFSFQDAEKLYLVMDFMQGGDLMGLLIEKDIFSIDATRFYIGELCLAVHSVHVLGYCHRDLKPDNILLCANGHVKLADFGLAKQLKKVEKKKSIEIKQENVPIAKEKKDKELQKAWQERKKLLAHSMVGTPDYMAPEIFTHDGYDEECDWWSVGAIMFECLAGYAPFYSGNDTDIQDTVHNVKNWQTQLNLKPIKSVNGAAADLISQLMTEPSQRLNFDAIQKHPFFKGFDWSDAQKNTVPYHKPGSLDSETDTRYFLYDPDESEDDDSDENEFAPVKSPVGKVKDFTYYVEPNKDHHLTDLWIAPPTANEEDE